MDNSAPENDLAEELMATRMRVQDLETQVEELSQRIGNLALQLGKLTKVLKQVMSEGMGTNSVAPAQASSQPGKGEAPPSPHKLPRELQQAIRLVTENHSEDAQRIITGLPREVLAEHPGVVAIVAAAVRIRKGEMQVARAALSKARELLSDESLLAVVSILEDMLD